MSAPSVFAATRCAVFVACAAALGAPALADVKGDVFQSKGGEEPLLVWNATPAVVDIVDAKQPRDAALHDLEASAVDVLAERAPTLKDAKRLTVRVVYEKTGAVNPAYGTATFLGVERLFELSADAATIQTSHQALADALRAGKVPAAVHIVASGVLPPLTAAPAATTR